MLLLGLAYQFSIGVHRHCEQPSADGQPVVVVHLDGAGLTPGDELDESLWAAEAADGYRCRDGGPQPQFGVLMLDLGHEQFVAHGHRVTCPPGALEGSRERPEETQSEFDVVARGP